VYLNWMENIQDWCISRQLWWGHRIPVWYRKGADRNDPANWHISVDGPADPQDWEQEEDVLDTWASSWLWPFATLGWPDADAMRARSLDAFYPTQTLVTGPDIIFFWVARMIMAGLAFTRPGEPAERRVPFRDVYFTGIIRDAQGRKMSKSLGNSPDPLDLIARHGADGLRFGLLQIAPLGQDIRFDEARVQVGRNFCTKLWNAARFRQMQGESGDVASLAAIVKRIDPARLDDNDHFILTRLADTVRGQEKAFAEFDFAGATQQLYGFFWNDFCDWYVEVSKSKVADEATKPSTLAIQDLVLRQFLLLFHPFAPFVTEELWHKLGFGAEGTFLQDTTLHTADALLAALAASGVRPDVAAGARVARLQEFCSLVRQLKADQGAAMRRDVRLRVLAAEADWAVLAAETQRILRLVAAAELERVAGEPNLPALVTPFGTVYLDTGVAVDAAAERVRLTKELEKLAQHIAGTEARLANPAFTGKAPPAVIDGARKQLADLQAKRTELERLLAAL
jgi:valyl-tRNA synthetase